MADQTLTATITWVPVGGPANLIAPGTFGGGVESWTSDTFSGYVAAGVATSSAQKHGGSNSLLVTWPTADFSWADRAVTGFTIGLSYVLILWVYVPIGSPDVCALVYGSVGRSETVTAKGVWTLITHTWLATSTSAYVGVEAVGPVSGGQCFIDDGEFQELWPWYRVIVDGSDTDCPADSGGVAAIVTDRVTVRVRTPQMPTLTGKVTTL